MRSIDDIACAEVVEAVRGRTAPLRYAARAAYHHDNHHCAGALMGFGIPVKLTAPELVAAIDRLGAKMSKLIDELVAAAARGRADAEAITAAFQKLGATIERLTAALANQPDDAALVQVLADMNAEHAALGAALAGMPADPAAPEAPPEAVVEEPAPATTTSRFSRGTGEAGG